ncbi:hypothetical protein TSUD_347840, partial [Trifolium subterraneum]
MAALEAISQITDFVSEFVFASDNVLVKKGSFKELGDYLQRIAPILTQLRKEKVSDSETFNNAIEILNREIKDAKKLVQECSNKSKVYLLVNCRTVAKRLKHSTSEISRAIGLLPLATSGLSAGTIEEIERLCVNMQAAEFKAAVSEEEILEKIELGIQEKNFDRSYANDLLLLIADALGITKERSTLKKELEEFKSEIENEKDRAEAIQMDQIIALLERSDAASSTKEKELKYIAKRDSLGTQPLEPLQSFFCPITQDVMVDPVETSSGQTFERSAIEKWFAEGQKMCPLSGITLDTSILRPNKTLKQSIEEWRDRNTVITIASMREKIQSGDEVGVLHCLQTLQGLCEQKDQHREWVVLENYIPVLIQFLSEKNRDIRNHILVILCMLVKDNEDAKERIAKVDNAIESIVHSLGRRLGERKLAVALLLELSKYDLLRKYIGKVQGCILLLVTMSSSEDSQAARDATELLEKLSCYDQNVILMAKANYFKHLLQRLSTGPDDVKMIMVKMLAEMESTDHNKEILFDSGILAPLLHLVSHNDVQMKLVALKALQNLSSLKKNGLEMIRQDIKNKLRKCPSVLVLVKLFENESLNLRASAVKLFSCLVESSDEATILQHVNQKCVETLLQILKSSSDEEEIVSAMGIIHYLPKIEQITQWLLDAGALPIICNYIQEGKDKDLQKSKLVENSVGALCRFTVPTKLEWQKRAAETGIITALVQLLESGTAPTKQLAALSLTQFSKSSQEVSSPMPKRKGFWCFSAQTEAGCLVHGGVCTVESSFCLLEADAVGPLAKTLGESDFGVCETSLDALLTLIDGEKLQS